MIRPWSYLVLVCGIGILLFSLPTQASAATYYVATTGSDANPGTITQPFRTINHGVSVLQPGDMLQIRAGTYDELVSIDKNGTARNPITIKVYPGESATIRKSGTVNYYEALITVTGSYLVLDGFVLDGGSINRIASGVQVDGANTSFNKIQNNKAINTGVLASNGAHDNIFKSNTVSGQSLYAIHCAVNNLFEDNYVYWSPTEGSGATNGSHGNIFRRNVFADNEANFYIDGSKNILVEENLFYVTDDYKRLPHPDPEQAGAGGSAINLAISLEDHYEGCGQVRAISGITVRNNIFYGGRYGLLGTEQASNTPSFLSNLTVTGNTFIKNYAGIRIGDVDYWDPAPFPLVNSRFTNNIILQGDGTEDDLDPIWKDFVANRAIAIDYPGTGNTFSNNLYFATDQSASQKFKWGAAETDFNGWVNLTGEANSLWASPQLQNALFVPPRLWSDWRTTPNPPLPYETYPQPYPAYPLPPPSPVKPLAELAAPYRVTATTPPAPTPTLKPLPPPVPSSEPTSPPTPEPLPTEEGVPPVSRAIFWGVIVFILITILLTFFYLRSQKS
jgi:hypothetical protein